MSGLFGLRSSLSTCVTQQVSKVLHTTVHSPHNGDLNLTDTVLDGVVGSAAP
jgi:hypothetical protein